jgi:hypothetical protein
VDDRLMKLMAPAASRVITTAHMMATGQKIQSGIPGKSKGIIGIRASGMIRAPIDPRIDRGSHSA